MFLKIGELAKRCGLTVRTLHHYDAIGLLSPSVRTESGARLYGQPDLIRLHRIQALKHLGYALPDIRSNLDDPGIDPLEIMERQIHVLQNQARQAQELSERLQHLAQHLSIGSETASADWLNLLEMMMLYQKHLSDDEMVALRHPQGSAPHEIGKAWTALIDEVTQAMQQCVPADSARAQALSWRWMRLTIAMTGNNPVLAGKLKALQHSEARAQEIMGIGPAKFEWIGRAFAHARCALLARYLSPAETEEVRRRQIAGMAHMDAWPNLVALVRSEMDRGTPPEDPTMQALAQRWQQLFRDSYCGDDRALEGKVRAALAQEPDLMLGVGVDESLLIYLHSAVLHLHRPQHDCSNAGPKPSAQLVAMQRAAHQLLDHPPVLDDPLALRILGQADAAALRANPGQYQDPTSRGLRSSLVVRSRLAEDECASAFANGVRQCVILGAGLDTYAYRQPNAALRMFEVDLPATQQWKRDCLRAARIPVPSALSYVPVDFETSTLSQGLAQAGFDPDQPAFFIWLGVVMYLEHQAVTDTLRFIANCAAGSTVVFDYVVTAESLPPLLRVPMQVMAKHLAARGEPWKSYYEPAALANQLGELGFARVHNFTPHELNQRYFSDRQDGMQLGGLSRLMHATV